METGERGTSGHRVQRLVGTAQSLVRDTAITQCHIMEGRRAAEMTQKQLAVLFKTVQVFRNLLYIYLNCPSTSLKPFGDKHWLFTTIHVQVIPMI
jgi:hypothetical protein